MRKNYLKDLRDLPSPLDQNEILMEKYFPEDFPLTLG
jgi:hypothetical protein